MKTAYLSGIKAELELNLNEEDVPIVYHSGDCTASVAEVYAKDYVKNQLAKFDKDAMIDILNNVGYAFDENDREEIEQLIVFEAASSLTDDE